MIKIMNAVHNIVSVNEESIPDYLQDRNLIYYIPDQDMIVVVGWGEDTKRISEIIVDYLELSPEGKQKAEEFCMSLGSDCAIRVNEMLKEIACIRSGKESEAVLCSV